MKEGLSFLFGEVNYMKKNSEEVNLMERKGYAMKHYVEVWGDREETAVFLPGTGWAGSFGMPIAETLADKFTVHMLDLPGIGRSDGLEGVVTMADAANWLNDYLESKQINKVTIIGHSLGGGIGLTFSYLYPEKVRKLVLLDIGFAKIERFPVQMFGSVGYFLPVISILHRMLGQKFLGEEKPQSNSLEPKPKTEEEIMKIINEFGFEDSKFIRKSIETQQETSLKGISLLLALYRCNMPKMLSRVKVPCLVLYGNREDKPLKLQKKINRQVNRIKNSNTIMKELHGGHYAHVTDHRTLRYIKDFIQ